MIIVGQVTSVTGFVPHLLQFCHPIRSPLHLHSSSVLHRICNKMQRQVSLDEVQCHKRDMQGINLRNVLNGILIYFQFFKNKLCPSCVLSKLKYLLRTWSRTQPGASQWRSSKMKVAKNPTMFRPMAERWSAAANILTFSTKNVITSDKPLITC